MAMGMQSLHGLKVRASRVEVLGALQNNRTEHAKIAAEAKAGYAEKCIEQLQAKIDYIRSKKDKFNERVVLSLPTPEDHTKSYDVAIKMLEIAVDPVIELDAEQVKNFVMDEWDWKDSFIGSNKIYSATARSYED